MPGRPGCQAAHAFRDAARDAPEPGYHKPKNQPAGEARASYCLRTNRVGAQASPAPLHYQSTRGGNAGGGFVTSYASAWVSGLLWAGRSIASMRAISGTIAPTISMCRGSMVKLSVMYSRPGQKVQILAPAWKAPQ